MKIIFSTLCTLLCVYLTLFSSAHAALQDGLVAFYPFSGNANDASGHGYDGTSINTTSIADRSGIANSAYNFDGTSSVINVSRVFSMTAAQTVVAWVKPNDKSIRRGILEKAVVGFGGEVDFALYLETDGTVSWDVNTDDGATGIFVEAHGQTPIPLGQWSCLTTTIDQANDQVQLYVNGVLDASVSMGGRTIRNTNRAFRIGEKVESQSQTYFSGGIDDVRVFNRILTTTEIGTLVNDGTSLQITSQPLSQSVSEGQEATFSVSVVGTQPISYQWFHNSTAIKSANTSTLSLVNTAPSDLGNYTVSVASAFGNVTSQPAQLTVLSNLAPAVQVQPQYTTLPVTNVKKLIVVTHGWEPEGILSNIDWLDLQANTIAQELQDTHQADWSVYECKWIGYASTPLPYFAMKNAENLGRDLGQQIVNGGYTQVHLIAHSAGAVLIQTASEYIKMHNSSIVVQTTFLDPYVGLAHEWENRYGYGADWADDYYSHDFWTGGETFSLTEGALNHTFNVDVTWLDKNATITPQYAQANDSTPTTLLTPVSYVAVSTHEWPHDFYTDSIPPNVLNGAAGYGFALSAEGGGSGCWSSYTRGLPSVILSSNGQALGQGSIPVVSNGAIDFSLIPHVISPTGGVQISSAGFTLNTYTAQQQVMKRRTVINHNGPGRRSSVSTGDPAWFSFAVNGSNPVNYIQFDAQFTSDIGAGGLIGVYWNGLLLGNIDERNALTGMQTYTFVVTGLNQTGANCLGIRLDQFGTQQSSVTISNVTPGFAGLNAPIQMDINPAISAGIVLTLSGVPGFTYLVQKSADLINWAPMGTISLSNSNPVSVVDTDTSLHLQQFYRLVSPW